MSMESKLRLWILPLVFLSWPAWASNPHRPRSLYQRADEMYLDAHFSKALVYAKETIKADPNWLRSRGLEASIEERLGNIEEAVKDANWIFAHHSTPFSQMRTGELLASGISFEIRGEGNLALEAYAEMLSRGIKTPEVLAGRSLAYQSLGKYQEAFSDINDAIQIEAEPSPLYLYQRAFILYKEKKLGASLKDLIGVMKKSQSDVEAYILLGNILFEKGDSERAEEAYEKALKLNPDDDRPYLALSRLEFAAKQSTAAYENLDRAVQEAGGDEKPYLERAKAYFASGKKSKAEKDYREALGLYWLSPPKAIQIGDYFAQNKNIKAADLAYSKAVKESLCLKAPCAQIFLTAILRRANLEKNEGNLKAALKDFSLAIEMGPSSPIPWALRAQIEEEQGEKDKALDDLDQAVGISPQDVFVHLSRAGLYASTHHPEKALEDLNTAIKAEPQNAKAYNDRGVIEAEMLHQKETGFKDLLKAVSLAPKLPAYQYNLGVVQYEMSDFLGALKSLGEALKLGEDPKLVLSAQAKVYSRLGDLVHGLKDVDTILAKNPKYAPAYYAKGLLYWRVNDYAKAVKFFGRAADLDEKNASYLIDLARAQGAAGDAKEALKEFQEALKVKPRSKRALTGVCEAWRVLKKPEKAIPFCNQALEVDPSYPEAYFQLGLSYLDIHKARETLDNLNRAIILGLRKSQLYLAKAVAHAASHHYRQAHEDYRAANLLIPLAHSPEIGFAVPHDTENDFYRAIAEAAPLSPTDKIDPYLLLIKADADANAGRFDEAITRYSKALDILPSNPQILAARGEAYIAYHLYDSAKTDFESAISGAPHDISYRLELASLLIIRKEYQDALSEISAALNLDPNNARAYFLGGNVRYFQKDFQKALDNYSLAVQKDPASAQTYNGLGLGYFALGNYPKAVAAFSRAIELSPMATRYWRNRASAYTKMGQYENAASDFRSAALLNQDPNLSQRYRLFIERAEALAGNPSK